MGDLAYADLLRASRDLPETPGARKIKVALLSDASTQRLVPLLGVLLQRQGLSAEVYEAPFDAIDLEAYDPNSGLYRFAPDVVVVLNVVQALRARFMERPGSADSFTSQAAERTTNIWDALQRGTSASVIQSNFVLPYERFFGNYEQKVAESFYATVLTLNRQIAESSRQRPGVLIADIEAVSSWVGRRNWFDDRFWDSAKYLCGVEFLPLVAKALVDVIVATRGKVTKCLVLDLDNTLWGGVIGDDGLDGILLSGHGDGEAFYRLQLYLRELRRRGIVLAVCSKNSMENAVLPFEKHPEMVLRKEDIAVFLANWNDKAENIRKIRETLNIGFDSMVFLDDNPFERNLVRELIPEICVPELPEDPADYVRAISELNLFEAISFSSEDLKRTEMYRAEAERQELHAGFASVEEFLKSLDMRITVARFDSFNLPRIAQLLQRSNQFNLTTRRLSEAECRGLMEDPHWIPLYVKLADRLGDHGLISVVILQPEGEEMKIRDWLMSCRVLGRGVEQFVMNRVFEETRRQGLDRVTGEYIPTAKNGMVKDFFAQFGFAKHEEINGGSRWSLSASAYKPATTHLNVVEPEGVNMAG